MDHPQDSSAQSAANSSEVREEAGHDPRRRGFLKIAAGSAAALVAGASTLGAQDPQSAPPATANAAEAGDNRYTRGMAAFVSELRYERIPAEVIDRIKLLA